MFSMFFLFFVRSWLKITLKIWLHFWTGSNFEYPQQKVFWNTLSLTIWFTYLEHTTKTRLSLWSHSSKLFENKSWICLLEANFSSFCDRSTWKKQSNINDYSTINKMHNVVVISFDFRAGGRGSIPTRCCDSLGKWKYLRLGQPMPYEGNGVMSLWYK